MNRNLFSGNLFSIQTKFQRKMSDDASVSKYQDETQLSRMERRTRSARKAAALLETGVDEFLKFFDPERSEREKRKLNRRLYPGAKKHVLYDERGIYFQTGEDLCDCLERSCPGCHFSCPKCKSTKCGHECRVNRKWTYDSIENEGSDIVIKNPVLKE